MQQCHNTNIVTPTRETIRKSRIVKGNLVKFQDKKKPKTKKKSDKSVMKIKRENMSILISLIYL